MKNPCEIARTSQKRCPLILGVALLALFLSITDGRGAQDPGFRQTSAGTWHAVAVKTDGTLWAWGRNWAGQLGDGSTTGKSSPVQVGTATNWQAAAAGYAHTVAVKTDGALGVG